MNPRQRRGVVLTAVSVLGAAAVFVGVSSYTASVAHQLGPTRPVLVLTRDVPSYQPLRDSDLEVRTVPYVFATRSELSEVDQIRGRVPVTGLVAGSHLQDDMLVPAPAARPGEREVTVNVGVEASIAAALQPGDRVDVIAAYEEKGKAKAHAEATVSGARVLRVKRLQAPGETDAEAAGLAGDTVLAVTFALVPKDVARVVLAQTVAKTLRLALVPPNDTTVGGWVR